MVCSLPGCWAIIVTQNAAKDNISLREPSKEKTTRVGMEVKQGRMAGRKEVQGGRQPRAGGRADGRASPDGNLPLS
jgi:hypothetical protein